MKHPFLPIACGVLAILLIGLVPCPAMGQVLTKKPLTEADYSLWGMMDSEQLSENGKWVSYRMSYESKIDTLFVMNTYTKKKFFFDSATDGQFNSRDVFAYKKKDVLVLLNLKSGKEVTIPSVTQYDFSANGNILITLEAGNTLVVRKENLILGSINNVMEYRLNDEKTLLAYATFENGKGSVGYLKLEGKYNKQVIVKPAEQRFQVLTWQHKGKRFAFYGVVKSKEEVYHYDLGSNQLSLLKNSNKNFPAAIKISPDQNVSLTISNDGQKVFFGITNLLAKDTTCLSNGVAIWNAKDKVLYPDRKLRSSLSHPQYLAVWYPGTGVVRQLSTEQHPWIMLTGKQDYAIIADPLQYEPQYQWIADRDYYLLHLETGTTELFLKEQSGFMDQMGISPNGQFITYYRNRNWWVYDIKKKVHTNLTKDLYVSWDNRKNDPANELKTWGHPGWLKDGTHALFYDYNDIWVIPADGKQRRRLTNGKEKQLRFRLDSSAISNKQEANYSGIGLYTYDLSKNAILTVLDLYDGANGYFLLKLNKEITPLAMDGSSITKIQRAKDSNAFIYVTQRYDNPPTLVFGEDSKTEVMVKSNMLHQYYQWGKSQMIHYKDSKGNLLNGALFYPANYEATKQYPMIVFIYETLSQDLNKYVNPSIFNSIGFNITNLTTNGYAVLLPDIAFEKGNPGFSALDCVTSATNKVIEMGVTKAGKIGLIGHSFGAYETNFIITHTDLFSAAISGSGVSDILGHYFTINKDYNTIDGWRYENQQYRMGFSFFENQEAYFKNSPLTGATKVKTPLLTWAGDLDENVQPRQAGTFYAALRRLKKEHIMLVYPNDGHILYNPKNQQDLTSKMKDWFNYYLKNEPKPKWMKSDNE